jgi:hypothetical protein
VYASPVLFELAFSATGATLDTGGWLNLTRQGLTPCKIRQALLGALTPSSGAAGVTAAFAKIIYFNFTTTFKNGEDPSCHLKRNVGRFIYSTHLTAQTLKLSP